MDSTRDNNRVVRFRDSHHELSCSKDLYKPQPKLVHDEPRESRANISHDHYDQTVPLLHLSPEFSRNKLDHLMLIRRNIVESLNLLSNERQSLFQNQQNCYQEARQFFQEHSRSKGRNRHSNFVAMSDNDCSYNRYHTINDIPRIRYHPNFCKDTEPPAQGDGIPDPCSEPSYFKAATDNWLYPPSLQYNLANESVPLTSSEIETENYPVIEDQSQKRSARSKLSDNYLQSWDNFLERSWPRRRSSGNSRANGDLIRYLDMVEKNESKPQTKPSSLSQRNFRESHKDEICFSQQFQRPVEIVTERSQLNRPCDRARGLNPDILKSPLTLNPDQRITRGPSPNQATNSFGSHLSSPRRSETRESYDENSSSLFSSEADSDFLFYPCTSMAPPPPLPSLTTSLCYVSDLNSPTEDIDLPLRKRDNLLNGSFDDITKQFYLDDDALSDDVFVDDCQTQAGVENDVEDWLRYLDHSQRQYDRQTKELNANIEKRLSGGMKNGTIENESLFGTSSVSPNSGSLCKTENANSDVLNSETKDEDPDKNGSFNDSAECDDICSELSNLNLNLANAFDSLRRNSTQSKSRKLWKERRTRMKKSPARQFRSQTPRFEEGVARRADTVSGMNVEPRYFTFDTVDRTSVPKEDLSQVKKPLRGILKNKISSHAPQTDVMVEYDYCDMREMENEENAASKESNGDQSNLLIVQENKINDPLLICVNDVPKKNFVSVGIQVDLLEVLTSTVIAHDVFKAKENDFSIENDTLIAASTEVENPDITTSATDFVQREDAQTTLSNNAEVYENQLDIHGNRTDEDERPNLSPKVQIDTDSPEASEPLRNVGQALCLKLETSSDSESKPAVLAPQKRHYVRRGRCSDSDICTNIQRPDRCAGISMESFPASEVLLSKDDHEFHYLRSPTETGTTETIAVRKNSMEVYKWTRSWQRRGKNQINGAHDKEAKQEDLGSNEKANST